MPKITVKGSKALYQVEQELGGNERFTLYRVSSDTRPEQQLVLKIAKTVGQNGFLDREAFLLSSMAEEANRLEEEYAAVVKDGGLLNYQLGFPEVVDTFIAHDQGARRVVIEGFVIADKLDVLVPVVQVRVRDCVRVDPKTSAWVMGKLLKLLVFAHSQGIAVNNLSGENILLEREHHFVALFDWSSALSHKGGVPQATACEEIRAGAREIILLLGGDPATGSIPHDDQLIDGRYAEFLASLVRGEYNVASKAHSAFYETVEALWGKKFHCYSSYPLN